MKICVLTSSVGPVKYGGTENLSVTDVLYFFTTIMKHKAFAWFSGPRYEFLFTLNESHMPYIASLMEKGIGGEVAKVFPIEKAAEAHEEVATNHARGKIVLKVSE